MTHKYTSVVNALEGLRAGVEFTDKETYTKEELLKILEAITESFESLGVLSGE